MFAVKCFGIYQTIVYYQCCTLYVSSALRIPQKLYKGHVYSFVFHTDCFDVNISKTLGIIPELKKLYLSVIYSKFLMYIFSKNILKYNIKLKQLEVVK